MKPPFLLLLSLCAISLTASPIFAEEPASTDNLIPNGNFEEGATGWPNIEGITFVEENGNTFMRLTAAEPGKQIQAYRLIPLTGADTKLKLTFRARWNDIVPGAESWHRGSLIVHFKDDAGTLMKPDPKPKVFKGSSEDWEEATMEFEAPENAAGIEIMPALFQVETGTLDVDDLVLAPAAP